MECIKLKCGAVIFPAKLIPNENGRVMHAMKSSDDAFTEFGEAYFSCVNYKAIKGWKKHLKMNMNLLVPVGKIRFYLREDDSKDTENVELGEDNYMRLYVPAGVWMAFEGVGEKINMLLNIASIEHDPLESEAEQFFRF